MSNYYWAFELSRLAADGTRLQSIVVDEWTTALIIKSVVQGVLWLIDVDTNKHSFIHSFIHTASHHTTEFVPWPVIIFAVIRYDTMYDTVLLDRPFCERSILCFAHVSFFPNSLFRRLQTDIFETFPHDVALVEKEALLCGFPKSAP